MTRHPGDTAFDVTWALFRDPYRFISKRCERFSVDSFEARLMLRPTIFLTGADAAKLFYDETKFVRAGAAPGAMVATLLGRGGVQALDGEAHRQRKRLFLSALTSDSVQSLADRSRQEWRAAAVRWQGRSRIVLFDEAREALTRAVCSWAGVPLSESEAPIRTRQLTAMFDGAGSAGLKHLKARRDRKLAEVWIEGIVRDVREGRLHPPEGSALRIAANHRNLDGEELPLHVAAVELINILRPTVAVSVFVVFAAHALHRHPDCRVRLEENDEAYLDRFVQEVRRFYPFFPSAVARVREDFDHAGRRFVAGRRTLLDLYGTNHDPRRWRDPERFDPERFLERAESPYDFIPQGGGTYERHHRCPGEPVAVELMKTAVRCLCDEIRYDVPEQDLDVAFSRLPALPRSRFILSNVRQR